MGLKSYHFCLQCILQDIARHGIKTVPGNLLMQYVLQVKLCGIKLIRLKSVAGLWWCMSLIGHISDIQVVS